MKEIDKIMDEEVFIVRNPHRKNKTDQYNVRVLQIDDALKLMQLAKQEVFDDIEKIECLQVCEVHNQALYLCDSYKKFKQRHLSTLPEAKELNSDYEATLKVCPRCKSQKVSFSENKYCCDSCGNISAIGQVWGKPIS